MNIDKLNARCAYNTYNGIWITAKEGMRCTVELRVTEHSTNPHGFVHGGLIFSACDVAACVAAMETEDEPLVTQSGSVSFVRPGMGERLRVEAECVYKGRRTALSHVEVYSEAGKLLSSGEFTLARKSERRA